MSLTGMSLRIMQPIDLISPRADIRTKRWKGRRDGIGREKNFFLGCLRVKEQRDG